MMHLSDYTVLGHCNSCYGFNDTFYDTCYRFNDKALLLENWQDFSSQIRTK